MIWLGAIGDDYTGSSDLANTFTKCGLRTVQTIGIPKSGSATHDAEAVVVALKSRSIAASDAVAQARAADRWLRERGARHVLFKICSTFDSTDAGNIGPVSDALRVDHRQQTVLVTPAFPETGRTVYQGHLFVAGVPLNETAMKDHPLNPMRDSNLVRVLARQSKSKVSLIAADIVSRGPEAIRKRTQELDRQGGGLAIVDAIFDAHLEALASVAFEQSISTGASGLGLGLANALLSSVEFRASRDRAAPPAHPPVGGHIAIIAGSCSAATLEQIEIAEKHMPCFRLDPFRLIAGNEEANRAVDWASSRLARGPLIIASSASAERVAALQAGAGRNASHIIEQSLADIAAALVQSGARRLIVAGGETSGAVVDRLGIEAFAVGPEIAPGVPILRTDSPERMLFALKSGNFGGPDFFRSAIKMMT
jgi:3-dehydrotetronate 4-kinase